MASPPGLELEREPPDRRLPEPCRFRRHAHQELRVAREAVHHVRDLFRGKPLVPLDLSRELLGRDVQHCRGPALHPARRVHARERPKRLKRLAEPGERPVALHADQAVNVIDGLVRRRQRRPHLVRDFDPPERVERRPSELVPRVLPLQWGERRHVRNAAGTLGQFPGLYCRLHKRVQERRVILDRSGNRPRRQTRGVHKLLGVVRRSRQERAAEPGQRLEVGPRPEERRLCRVGRLLAERVIGPCLDRVRRRVAVRASNPLDPCRQQVQRDRAVVADRVAGVAVPLAHGFNGLP